LVEYLFWAGALVLLALILAADYIWTRFQHTGKSRRTLALEAAGSLAVAGVVIFGLRQRLDVAGLLWTLALALPLFLLAAVATVEVWRRRKLSAFDRIIRQLRRELQRQRDELDRVIWQLRDLERRARVPQATPAAPVTREGEQVRLRRQVEAWQGAGGLARIRALKVAEWEEELAGLDAAGLQARRRQLEGELPGAVAERREALQVQLALLRLHELRGSGAVEEPASAWSAADLGLEAARQRRSDGERELARLQAELEQWQRERAAFLRQRIPLD
jgi:hypothetical protein